MDQVEVDSGRPAPLLGWALGRRRRGPDSGGLRRQEAVSASSGVARVPVSLRGAGLVHGGGHLAGALQARLGSCLTNARFRPHVRPPPATGGCFIPVFTLLLAKVTFAGCFWKPSAEAQSLVQTGVPCPCVQQAL